MNSCTRSVVDRTPLQPPPLPSSKLVSKYVSKHVSIRANWSMKCIIEKDKIEEQNRTVTVVVAINVVMTIFWPPAHI